MVKRIALASAPFLVVLACSESPSEPPAGVETVKALAPAAHSVRGRVDTGLLPGGAYTFSLSASRTGDVSTGRLQWTAGVIVSVDVTCIEVDGNRAIVTGVVTRSPLEDGLQFGVGGYLQFGLVDNGNPGDGVPDQITSAIVNNDTCFFPTIIPDPFLSLIDLQGSNVRIE